MFWNKNKIPKGYVETVDGYLIKESEAKMVISVVDFSSKIEWHRKENAPKYDVCDYGGSLLTPIKFYKNNVQVKKDGTPIGYYTQEEFDLLSNRIAELQAKIKELEEELEVSYEGEFSYSNYFEHQYTKNMNEGLDKICPKPKNKRGRPKKK